LQLKRAWDAGTVQSWDNLVEIGQHGEMVLRDGKPVHVPARISLLIPDRFVHDLRLHVDDLRWQIEQQIGAAPLIESEAIAGEVSKSLPAPQEHQRSRRGRGPRPNAPAIDAAAKKLRERGKSRSDYKTFDEYRRALCDAPGVDPTTRG
jgi:hypothetical protein